MAQAIGDILTPALGVALSPFPIVAVILTLLSDRGRPNGVAFATGWIIGLLVMVGLMLSLADIAGVGVDDDGPSSMALLIQLLLGIGLLLLAARKWSSRLEEDQEPAVPGWISMLDDTTPLLALGLGAAMSGMNPKNLLFNMVASTAIASSGASTGGEIVAWIIYIMMASATVIIPVIWFIASPASATAKLEQPRIWLMRNSGSMVAIMLIFIGVSQIGDAISGF
jgi:threonine/homoserine/homoserine lactone efflux protein